MSHEGGPAGVGRLEGKGAIITGGARGIGKAVARRFLREGASVVICDVRTELLENTRRELQAEAGPRTVQAVVADVTEGPQLDELVGASIHALGSIDVLVNNAGISDFTAFIDLDESRWRRTLDVNLTGVFLCAQTVAKVMVPRHSGVIINMASTNGIAGEALLSHYNASKGGVVLLTKTMAIELAPYGIRVNSICPGFIATDMAREGGMDLTLIDGLASKVPMGRRGDPEEVAAAAAFLASEDASYITGIELVVDGGQLCQQP